jgi:hypothetical protein
VALPSRTSKGLAIVTLWIDIVVITQVFDDPVDIGGIVIIGGVIVAGGVGVVAKASQN